MGCYFHKRYCLLVKKFWSMVKLLMQNTLYTYYSIAKDAVDYHLQFRPGIHYPIEPLCRNPWWYWGISHHSIVVGRVTSRNLLNIMFSNVTGYFVGWMENSIWMSCVLVNEKFFITVVYGMTTSQQFQKIKINLWSPLIPLRRLLITILIGLVTTKLILLHGSLQTRTPSIGT